MIIKPDYEHDEKVEFNSLVKSVGNKRAEFVQLQQKAKDFITIFTNYLKNGLTEYNGLSLKVEDNMFSICGFKFMIAAEYSDTKQFKSGYLVVFHLEQFLQDGQSKVRNIKAVEYQFNDVGGLHPSHGPHSYYYFFCTILEYIHNYGDTHIESHSRIPLA